MTFELRRNVFVYNREDGTEIFIETENDLLKTITLRSNGDLYTLQDADVVGKTFGFPELTRNVDIWLQDSTQTLWLRDHTTGQNMYSCPAIRRRYWTRSSRFS